MSQLKHPDEDRLLKPNELAQILGVDRTTLNNWIRDGLIPSVLIGRRTRRFLRPQVEAWLASCNEMKEVSK